MDWLLETWPWGAAPRAEEVTRVRTEDVGYNLARPISLVSITEDVSLEIVWLSGAPGKPAGLGKLSGGAGGRQAGGPALLHAHDTAGQYCL